MENIYENIMKIKNKPLFKEKIAEEIHKIFYKYTSYKYFKYIYNLLDSLCKKCPYENNSFIFHLSLHFILKILYKCENTPYLTNLDLMVLNCFSLAIKAIIQQKDFPSLNRLKKIYEEKYINYKNEEIREGEIICLKLLNYNINILTAYECVIFLTQNDLKLKELSLTNLNFLIINNLKQFIYNPSFDIAKECIIRIKEKIIVKEPKIIKKKIISQNGFNSSPSIKKYSSSEKIVNSTSDYNINNEEFQITIKNVNGINKPKFYFANTKKSCILINKINVKNSADKIYKKKNCNNIHPGSSTSLITEANIVNENNYDNKNELFFNKLIKLPEDKYIYKNNTSDTNYFKINKKSKDMTSKNIYLNNNKIKYNRNLYFDKTVNMNNTHYFKKNYFCNNYNISKENDSNYLNLYNKRNDSFDPNNFTNNKYSVDLQNNKTDYYNFFHKGNQQIIETKKINLGSLNKNNNSSNFQRYNMSLRKNEKHVKLNSSTNYFNYTNSFQDTILNSNKSIGNYYIRW